MIPRPIFDALKRMIDLLVATTAGLLLTPLLLAIAAAVAISLGRPVIFSQPRPGRGGRSFILRKFRTMKDARDAEGRALPDSERLTSLGRFLRSTSLDELPELWNVIRGEMSLVGPRPLLTEYLPLYSTTQARRHEVRPGITGWAQVNGRNDLDWVRRFELDVWYVDHRSVALDSLILCLTIWRVIRRDGINQPGQATMEPFRGNPR